MPDATTDIRFRMEKAGITAPAIDAFLFQYQKLARNDEGLIPESLIDPCEDLPSIEDQPPPSDTAALAEQTVVLKLNGGLGTSMGLEKAKCLLKVRDELTFLDIIVRQFLHLRSAVAPKLRLLLMNSFSTSSDTAAALARYPERGDPKQI